MKKVQVKLTKSRIGQFGTLKRGTTVTVSEHEAARMYAAGECESLDGQPIEHTELTLKEIEEAEAAKRPKKAKKTKGAESKVDAEESTDPQGEETETAGDDEKADKLNRRNQRKA